MDFNFRSLFNYKDKKIYQKFLFGKSMNLDLLQNKIYKDIKIGNVLAIIIYGSFLHSRKAKDFDCLIVVKEKVESKNVIISKDTRKKIVKGSITVYVPFVESSGTIYGGGCETITEYMKNDKYNPIPLDIKIRNIKDIYKELKLKKDTCCFNALKHGCFIYKHSSFDGTDLFNISNDNKYILKRRFFNERNWKVNSN